MAYRWETASSIWLEDEQSAQFELASSDGLSQIDWQVQARNRLPDVAHLLGASLPLVCRCAPIYPEGFAFCPQCGAALNSLARQTGTPPNWWGPWADQGLPRHVPHGLAITSLALGDSLEERPAAPARGRPDTTMPAPPNAHCVFAAATFGFPVQRLIALAHRRNVLLYWDPLAQAWHVMAPEDHAADLSFSASSYAWLPARAARRGEFGVVPTSTGLHRLWINPVSETYRTEPVFEGALAGAPGTMRRHLACLFNTGGGTRLWSAHTDLSSVQLHDCDGAPESGYARPLGYDGAIVWRHRRGQLVWQPGSAPRWIAWPGDWAPRTQLGGPTQSRDGRLWLIGHADGGYSFLELGRSEPQRERVDGARLGFAGLLFRRGHCVIDEPWSPEHIEDPDDADSLVMPLLRGFNNNRSQPSGLVLRFHKVTSTAEDLLSGRVIERTSVEWIGKRNVVLDDIARLKHPSQCMPFVYNNCLWLHHPDWNQIRGWRLEDLS